MASSPLARVIVAQGNSTRNVLGVRHGPQGQGPMPMKYHGAAANLPRIAIRRLAGVILALEGISERCLPTKDFGWPLLNRRRKQHRHKFLTQARKLATTSADAGARGKAMRNRDDHPSEALWVRFLG